jgi:kexin
MGSSIKCLHCARSEDPVGDWTIKVSDLNRVNETGKFLGWRMKFWGTTIDASKAKEYELLPVDYVLPLVKSPFMSPTITTEHSKSTVYLPGESTSGSDNIEDWFKDMSNVVSTHRTYFGALGFAAVVSLFSAVFFWRRRAARLRSQYSSVAMSEDAEVDEARRAGPVSSGRHPQDRISQGLGFHSSFLDDDDISTAGPTPAPKYRDEPQEGFPSATPGGERLMNPKFGGEGRGPHGSVA